MLPPAFPRRWLNTVAAAVVPVLLFPTLAAAQAPADTTDPRAAVLAVVEASLERISAEDMEGFAALMLEGGILASIGTRDGEVLPPRIWTAEDFAARTPSADFVERGFEPDVRIDGRMATVRLPYDFYVDGAFSHCGVDVFTLLHTRAGWRIATVTFTMEQPPACRKHPDGPPARETKGTDGP